MATKASFIDNVLFQDMQENELASVFAKFPNDVIDLRAKGVSSVWHPVELKVAIAFEERKNPDVTIKVDLYVKCTDNYPNSVPVIEIKSIQGICNAHVLKLRQNLINSAMQLIGKDMILELIREARIFLRVYRDQPEFISLYRKVAVKIQEPEDLIPGGNMKEENRCVRVPSGCFMDREVVGLRSLVEKNLYRPQTSPPDISLKPEIELLLVEEEHRVYDCDRKCNCVKKLDFDAFKSESEDIFLAYGQCNGHNCRGCIVYPAFNLETGEQMVVIKWSLPLVIHHAFGTEKYKSFKKELVANLKDLRKTVKTLSKLEHDGLVHYLSMMYVKQGYNIVVYVLQEYVCGNPLYVFSKRRVTYRQLQRYCRGILVALMFLHENSIVHGSLRSRSIFLDNKGCVRLADYCVDRRLSDLNRMCSRAIGWKMHPLPLCEDGKKDDVYQLGILLLNFYLANFPKNVVPVILQSLDPSFRDFLHKCLIHDPQKKMVC